MESSHTPKYGLCNFPPTPKQHMSPRIFLSIHVHRDIPFFLSPPAPLPPPTQLPMLAYWHWDMSPYTHGPWNLKTPTFKLTPQYQPPTLLRMGSGIFLDPILNMDPRFTPNLPNLEPGICPKLLPYSRALGFISNTHP